LQNASFRLGPDFSASFSIFKTTRIKKQKSTTIQRKHSSRKIVVFIVSGPARKKRGGRRRVAVSPFKKFSSPPIRRVFAAVRRPKTRRFSNRRQETKKEFVAKTNS